MEKRFENNKRACLLIRALIVGIALAKREGLNMNYIREIAYFGWFGIRHVCSTTAIMYVTDVFMDLTPRVGVTMISRPMAARTRTVRRTIIYLKKQIF